MTEHGREIIALDPVWAEQVVDQTVCGLIPPTGGDTRVIESKVVFRGPVVLVTRVLGAYLRTSHRWELWLISGREPKATSLLAADGHVSIFRHFEIRCELSPQGSLLEREATIVVDPHWESVLCNPEPINLLIKE